MARLRSSPSDRVMMTMLLLAAGCAVTSHGVREEDRIVFFGDSITQQGAKPKGYVTLVRDSLERRLPGIEVLGAGISGNKVADLQARLDRDVLSKRPTVVVIYVGINDVWHWALKNHTGTTKQDFEAGLRNLVARIRSANARVILCTPSVIGEKRNGENGQDTPLDEYSAISRRVAREEGAALCDLRQLFVDYLRKHNSANAEYGILTTDGVHLNAEGNRFVALQMLEALAKPF